MCVVFLSQAGASAELVCVANEQGMHAAHLAANVECLEALLEAGASLCAEDSHGRTPLFVACAMNRFDCATFLLEVLDLEPNGSELMVTRHETQRRRQHGTIPFSPLLSAAQICVWHV